MNDKYKYLRDFNDETKEDEVQNNSENVKKVKVKDGLVEHINKELILEDGRKLLRD